MNELRDPYEMLHYLKDTTIPKDEVQLESQAELLNKMPTGIFKDEQRPEYTELYRELCEAAKAGGSTAGSKAE